MGNNMITTKTKTLEIIEDGKKFYVNNIKYMKLEDCGRLSGKLRVHAYCYATGNTVWFNADSEVTVWEVVENEEEL